MRPGTNASATNRMLREGADEGATGENAIIFNVARADIIAGPLAIIAANSMLGELTPAMSCAIASSSALKVLIPMEGCNIKLATCETLSLESSIARCISIIKDSINKV